MRLCPESWPPPAEPATELRRASRPLLELDVERARLAREPVLDKQAGAAGDPRLDALSVGLACRSLWAQWPHASPGCHRRRRGARRGPAGAGGLSGPRSPARRGAAGADDRRLVAAWLPGRTADLRLLTLSPTTAFDGGPHTGRLVVHRDVATTLVGVFRHLYAARFPIRRVRPVDAYGGSDFRSIEPTTPRRSTAGRASTGRRAGRHAPTAARSTST